VNEFCKIQSSFSTGEQKLGEHEGENFCPPAHRTEGAAGGESRGGSIPFKVGSHCIQ